MLQIYELVINKFGVLQPIPTPTGRWIIDSLGTPIVAGISTRYCGESSIRGWQQANGTHVGPNFLSVEYVRWFLVACRVVVWINPDLSEFLVQFFGLFLEAIVDALQKEDPEDVVLVVGGVDRAAQNVGSLPEVGFSVLRSRVSPFAYRGMLSFSEAIPTPSLFAVLSVYAPPGLATCGEMSGRVPAETHSKEDGSTVPGLRPGLRP